MKALIRSKYTILFIGLFLFLILLGLFMGPGTIFPSTWSRQNPKTMLTIAILDMDLIHRDAVAYKGFKELIESKYQQFHEDIHRQEKMIRESYDELKEAAPKNHEEASKLQQRKEELSEKLTQLDKTIRAHKESLSQDFNRLKESLDKSLMSIIEKIRKEHGVQLILNCKSASDWIVIYGDPQLNLTSQVIAEFNKEVPGVNLSSN